MSPVDPINQLAHQLAKLPGVGRKSAIRLAYFILRDRGDYATQLARSIAEAKQRVQLCSQCGNLTEENPCRICADTRRDRATLCVLEQVPDMLAVEATGSYRGMYHVLNGAISPLNGIGPDQLRMAELLRRIETEPVDEIIMATNPTVDGEATALYVQKLLGGKGIKVTRIASGIPMGSDLEYLDRETISRALAGRRELE